MAEVVRRWVAAVPDGILDVRVQVGIAPTWIVYEPAVGFHKPERDEFVGIALEFARKASGVFRLAYTRCDGRRVEGPRFAGGQAL